MIHRFYSIKYFQTKHVLYKSKHSLKQINRGISFEKYYEIAINESNEHKIKAIIAEYNYLKTIKSESVPEDIDLKSMSELMRIESGLERKSYLKYLFLKDKYRKQLVEYRNPISRLERKSKADSVYKQIQMRLDSKSRLLDKNNELIYGLWRNCLFSRISNQKLMRLSRHKLRTAALFGPKLVIDLSFDRHMGRLESRKLVQELKQILRHNRLKARDPFDLHFFNSTETSYTNQLLRSVWELLVENGVDWHSDSYLDHFSRESLVYLTPNAHQVMTRYDWNRIYIIGGFVDKYNPKPLSLEMANNQQIVSMRLPIDNWTEGYVLSNKLYLPQVFQVLHIMKDFNKYESILRTYIKDCYQSRRQIKK